MIVHSLRLVRDALGVLAESQGLRVVSSIRLCGEAAIEYQVHKPDVVVAGVSFPDGDLVELAKLLRRLDPEVAILVVGEGTSGEFALSVQAGASAYLGADTRGSELSNAVSSVLAGSLFLAGVDGDRFFSQNGGSTGNGNGKGPSQVLPRVTPRERELLALLCLGRSNREIAERLFISEHTVRTHIQNIRGKLNVHSKFEAALLALRAGVAPGISLEPVQTPGAEVASLAG